MNIRLIVCDLDCTILRTDKTVSNRSVSVFEKCKTKGIITAVATARSEWAAKRVCGILNPDICIMNSGGLVKYHGRTLYKRVLPAKTSDGIIHELKSDPVYGEITAVTEDDTYFVSYTTPPYHPDYANGIVCDFSKPLGVPVYKITAELFQNERGEKIAAKYPDCSYVSYINERWGKFSHVEAEKMTALESILPQFGVTVDETAAFGDDLVDLNMIKKCGIGVAVENAVSEVKACADVIVKNSDEDGAVEWIEKNILH